MFFKLIALFAMVVAALAAPNPAPQYLTYSSGLDYVYPGVPSIYSASVPGVVSAYSAPVAPLTYSYPTGPVFVRK